MRSHTSSSSRASGSMLLLATGFSCCLVLPHVATAAAIAAEVAFDPLFEPRSSSEVTQSTTSVAVTAIAAAAAATPAVKLVVVAPAPAPSSESPLSSPPPSQQLLEPTLIASSEVEDLARLARLVDSARCPAGRSLQPSWNQPRPDDGEDEEEREAGEGDAEVRRRRKRRGGWFDEKSNTEVESTQRDDQDQATTVVADWGNWAAVGDAYAAEFADEADDDRDYVTIRYANGDQEEVEVADEFKDLPTSHHHLEHLLANKPKINAIGGVSTERLNGGRRRRPRDARMDLLATSSSTLPEWPLPLDDDGFVRDQDERGHVVLSRVAKVERQLVMIEIPAVPLADEQKRGRGRKSSRASRPRMRVEEREIVTEERDDVDWYVARDRPTVDPATGISSGGNTLTVAISSLSSTENLLELLAEGAAEAYWANASRLDADESSIPSSEMVYGEGSLMAPLPDSMFPFVENGLDGSAPRILRALEPFLERHAEAIIDQILEALEPTESSASILEGGDATQFPIPGWQRLAGGKPIRAQQDLLSSRSSQTAISRIEIVGHGLGADLGLIVAAALDVQLKHRQAAITPSTRRLGRRSRNRSTEATPVSIDIHTTLLGPSRIGNSAFADWIDTLAGGKNFHVRRIHSYADPVAHLPATWQGFRHFSSGEHWVDADPRRVWTCPHVASEDAPENMQCTNSIPIQKTSLLDHAGPYGANVYIDSAKCSQ